MLLGLACQGGKCLLAVYIFSHVAVKPCSSALSSTRANSVSAISFVPSCSFSSFASSHFSDSTLFHRVSQSDLEVGQGWHVLFATTAVFHGGSCHFSVWFHSIWIISSWLLKFNCSALSALKLIYFRAFTFIGAEQRWRKGLSKHMKHIPFWKVWSYTILFGLRVRVRVTLWYAKTRKFTKT